MEDIAAAKRSVLQEQRRKKGKKHSVTPQQLLHAILTTSGNAEQKIQRTSKGVTKHV